MMINEEIDKLKNNFKDIKLKIFEKAITIPKIVEYIKEYNINPLASPSVGAPALKYEDVNTETTSPAEVKGLIIF